MFTERIRRAVVVGAVLPAIVVGAACSEGDSAETVTSVLESGGTVDTAKLPPEAVVGQTASGTLLLSMDLSASAGAEDVDVDMTMSVDISTEVIEVSEDGSHVRRSKVDRLEVDSSESAVASEVESSMPEGLSYDETYDADGQLVSTEIVEGGELSESELAAAEEFVAQAETGSLYPPGAVVGVGALWSATTTFNSSGAVFDMVILNELVALTDAGYVVDTTIESDIDTSVEGERLTGTVTGGGQVTGSRDNPLVMAGNITVDMELGGGGMNLTMSMTGNYDFTDTPT